MKKDNYYILCIAQKKWQKLSIIMWSIISKNGNSIYEYRKLNLKDPNKIMILANSSIHYTWKNIKSTYDDNKFKTSAPVWNDEFDFLDGSYSISDIQDYFECFFKNHKL